LYIAAQTTTKRKKETTMSANTATRSSKSILQRMLPSLLLNILVPVVLYYLIKRYLTSSEVIALSVASLIPLVDIIISLTRRRNLDILALVTLMGTGAGILAALLGGSKEFVLISNGFFTGVLGLACFVSLLLLKRPFMFYVSRQFMAGHDPEVIATFNAEWQYAHARSAHRLITTVWGCTLLGQFLLRVLIALVLPYSLAVALSQVLLFGSILLTLLWTFAYGRRARQRGQQQRQAVL
jgi:hypothetical protein